MRYKHQQKIMITGSPGSGTSFLCKLLHYCGLNSGYDEEEFGKEAMVERGKGAEYLTDKKKLRELRLNRKNGYDNSPFLIKKPFMPNWVDDGVLGNPESKTVFEFAREYGWEIDYLIVSIRDFDNSLVANRRHDQLTRGKIRDKFEDDLKTKLWTYDGLVRTMSQAASENIPYSLISFPRLIDDMGYAYSKLKPVLTTSVWEFERKHKMFANPDMVHVR